MQIILFIFAFLVIVPRVSAAIVINEIFPKSADVSSTWIELYNTGPDSVSLDRWRLEINSSDTYILNASALISPNAFITLYQPQTGLTFNIEGDSVRLFDDKNNLIDSKNFLGILGYNTSIGRSADGGIGWAICIPTPDYFATPNKPNKCPTPPSQTPTATLQPTNSSTQKIIQPTVYEPYVITPTIIDESSKFAFPDVLGVNVSPTPTIVPISDTSRESNSYKKIWTIFLVTGVGLAITIMSIGLYKTVKRK